MSHLTLSYDSTDQAFVIGKVIINGEPLPDGPVLAIGSSTSAALSASVLPCIVVQVVQNPKHGVIYFYVNQRQIHIFIPRMTVQMINESSMYNWRVRGMCDTYASLMSSIAPWDLYPNRINIHDRIGYLDVEYSDFQLKQFISFLPQLTTRDSL